MTVDERTELMRKGAWDISLKIVQTIKEKPLSTRTPKETGVQRCTCTDPGNNKCDGQGGTMKFDEEAQEQGF